MEHKFKDLNQLLTELPEIGGPLDLIYIYINIYVCTIIVHLLKYILFEVLYFCYILKHINYGVKKKIAPWKLLQ